MPSCSSFLAVCNSDSWSVAQIKLSPSGRRIAFTVAAGTGREAHRAFVRELPVGCALVWDLEGCNLILALQTHVFMFSFSVLRFSCACPSRHPLLLRGLPWYSYQTIRPTPARTRRTEIDNVAALEWLGEDALLFTVADAAGRPHQVRRMKSPSGKEAALRSI